MQRCTIGDRVVDNIRYLRNLKKLTQHEYGHTRQSKYLGWFYLVVVRIPSVIRNIMSRINPKKYNSDWYYNGHPENWADKLGGVKWMN